MSSGGIRKAKNTNGSNSSHMSLSKKTLDIQHNNKMNDFHLKTQKLQQLKDELTRLEVLFDPLCTSTDDKEKINELRKDINILESIQEDELDYFVNTAPILFKYYDIIEKGCQDESIIGSPKVPEKSVLRMLMKHKEPSVQDDTVSKENEKEDRASLLERYMTFTDANFVKPIDYDIPNKCNYCGSMNMFLHMNDGFACCNDCSCMEYLIVDHERPSYKDPPREVSYFAYKRINHFNECLSQIQGKETTEIPDEVYDAILMEIKKQRINNIAELSVEKVREILKKLDLNKYYEHAPHIKHKLNGLPIPHLEPELEEKLRTMFKMIQQPFLKHMPPNRKNFLSYAYVLHKLIQLLGKDEYLPNFSLLKSREKLHQQDQIWKKICEELRWQFIRSI